MTEGNKNKIYIIFVTFCLIFFAIIIRAFFIQIINKKKLLSYSEGQLLRETTIFPKRGNIYDRNGHPLAINVQTYNIFAIPKAIKGKNSTLKRLSKIVPKLTTKKTRRALKNRTRFTWIERKIELSKDQVKRIKKLSGIFLEKTTKRIYPNQELMAQILGFVGVDNVGLGGVEYQFNDLLKGDAKIIKYLKDAKGRPIKFESYDTENKAQDLQLTLDKDLQAISEKYLKEAVKKHKAQRGGIGIMDANNGEVLAMAHYPTFDPNQLKPSRKEFHRPSFVTDPFEPGSVFKIFTALSALENKIVTTETNYFCEYGKLKVGKHTITESDTSKKHEWLSVADIIKFSSNIGTVKIAFDLGFPLLDRTIKKFSFGQKTNIELPGESRGIYNDKAQNSQLSLSNLSFGQGVATTGIQILAAYAAIANGGTYYSPTIVKGNAPQKGKKVMSPQMALKLQKILHSVVQDGTAKNIALPYFKTAGKTGTAQKANGSGQYEGYIPNFVGFPINVENNFVVYAYIDDPNGPSYSGSRVAAPLVKKIIEYMFFKNKEYQNLAVNTENISKSSLDKVLTPPPIISKGFGGKMPSFIGLDKKSSISLAQKVGIYLEHKGAGVVVKQSVKAGASFIQNAVITLEHRPPRHE